jgi:hypothetical protein
VASGHAGPLPAKKQHVNGCRPTFEHRCVVGAEIAETYVGNWTVQGREHREQLKSTRRVTRWERKAAGTTRNFAGNTRKATLITREDRSVRRSTRGARTSPAGSGRTRLTRTRETLPKDKRTPRVAWRHTTAGTSPAGRGKKTRTEVDEKPSPASYASFLIRAR